MRLSPSSSSFPMFPSLGLHASPRRTTTADIPRVPFNSTSRPGTPPTSGGLRPAREPGRHDRPTPMTGPKVPAEQLGGAVHPRPTHVGHPAGRLAECELDEPGSYLISVDGLDPEAGRKRYHR